MGANEAFGAVRMRTAYGRVALLCLPNLFFIFMYQSELCGFLGNLKHISPPLFFFVKLKIPSFDLLSDS